MRDPVFQLLLGLFGPTIAQAVIGWIDVMFAGRAIEAVGFLAH